MQFDDLISDLTEMWQNGRPRFIRTVLAIAFGIAAFTAALSVFAGFQETVDNVLTGFGGKVMTVSPRRDPAERQPKPENFDWDDVRALAAVSGVTSISLQKSVDGVPVQFFDREVRTKILGADPAYALIRNRTVIQGRFLETKDLDDERRVCVITPSIRKRFFPAGGFLGNALEVNGVLFQIVGCLSPMQLPRAFSGMNEEDGAVLIPLTTCETLFHQFDDDRIWLNYTGNYDTKKKTRLIKGRIAAILAFRHDQAEVFSIAAFDDLTQQPRKKLVIILMGLCTTAALCLLAGAVGIYNAVMVHETNGLALKAPDWNRLFWKSAVLSATGGCMGILFGFFIGGFIAFYSGMPIHFKTWVVLSGMACPLLAGISVGGIMVRKTISERESSFAETVVKENAQ